MFCPTKPGNSKEAGVICEIYTLNVGCVSLSEAVSAAARHVMSLAVKQTRRKPHLAEDFVSEGFAALVEVLERLRLGTLCPSGPTWTYILSYIAGKLRRLAACDHILLVPPTSYVPGMYVPMVISSTCEQVPAEPTFGEVDEDLLRFVKADEWEREYINYKLEEKTDVWIADKMCIASATLARRKAALQARLRQRLQETA